MNVLQGGSRRTIRGRIGIQLVNNLSAAVLRNLVAWALRVMGSPGSGDHLRGVPILRNERLRLRWAHHTQRLQGLPQTRSAPATRRNRV